MARRPRWRSAKSYARRAALRESYPAVLIVCEGEKSEPAYFDRLRRDHRLSNANVRITPAEGSDPMSVVSYALAEMADFDRAYCVFDRDGHTNYDRALARIAAENAGKEERLFGITSWPCFEVWLLLHFLYSSAPFERSARESACDKVVRALLRHLPDYRKGHSELYADIAPRTDDAVRNATLLTAENRRSGSTNPATRVHELVTFLRNLRRG